MLGKQRIAINRFMILQDIVNKPTELESFSVRREWMKQGTQLRTVVVCVDTCDEAGRSRLCGIAQYARQANWRIMHVCNHGKETAQEVAMLEPDGIIAYAADEWLMGLSKKMSVPLVDTMETGLSAPMTVSPDEDDVCRLAAEHFAKIGLTNIGYCGVESSAISERRKEAFLAQFSGNAVTAFFQNFTEKELDIQPMIAWLRQLPKPVGLLAFDDKLGKRILNACRHAKINVPIQIAVVGVNNDRLICELCWPPLSSLEIQHNRIGVEASELLDLAMQGKFVEKPHQKIAPVELVIRGSSGAPPVDDPLVKTAINLIREQAGKYVGVEQVAARLRVSRRNLDRRFSVALGRTVHDELADVRMKMARTYLADNSMKVASVAQACGFASAASFSRSFRMNFGLWPTDYRGQIVSAQCEVVN